MGATLLRVLSQCAIIAPFNPATYGNAYWIGLDAFLRRCAAEGFRVELVGLADAQILMPGEAAQQAHWNRLGILAAPHEHVVLELGNEWPINGFDPGRFTAHPGILCARGSALGDGFPFVPPWDYVTDHPGRSEDWPRKAKSAYDWYAGYDHAPGLFVPVVEDEPMGAAETSLPGRRSTDPDDFAWFAATAALLGAGATFHFEEGLVARVPGPVQTMCARAFFDAARSLPPEAALGTYTRGPFPDCPVLHSDTTALRTFARYSANEATAVVIRPTPAWELRAAPGWTPLTRTGPRGTIITLRRS